MIHYNVTFSFKDGVAHEEGLRRVAAFLGDLKNRALIDTFEIRQSDDNQHFVGIRFVSREQFNRPFKDVSDIGIHAGAHGFMIADVAHFTVAIAEDP